jgi:hypothetical protein
MAKQITFLFDHQADVLSISQGHPIQTDSIPLNQNVILHVEPKTNTIVGFSIIDFLKQFTNSESPVSIPLDVAFERVHTRKPRIRKKESRRKTQLK